MTTDDREHVGELLDAWRTGELGPAEGERVAAHLAECDRCREELAALEPLAATFERGFAAARRRAGELEPDWAAQRAAIVARTSGRPRAAGGRRAFWRWAPQLAAAAVAVIVIGVVWREAGPGPGQSPDPARVEAPAAAGPAAEAPESSEIQAESRDDLAARADGDAADESARAVEENRLGEAKARAPARSEVAAGARGREAEVSEQVVGAPEEEAAPPEQYRAADEAAALADRVEPAAPYAAHADLGRFERQAREALADRDTLAARRALALWGDTLAPRLEADEPPAALVDSLQALLEAEE